METAAIVQLIITLAPYAIKAGVDIAQIVARYQSGATMEEIIAEVEAKRNDLPDLDFAADPK
jgi:hypothetical protein